MKVDLFSSRWTHHERPGWFWIILEVDESDWRPVVWHVSPPEW